MDAHEQYANLLAIRNTELAIYWNRYNIQVLLNGGLMAAVLASYGELSGRGLLLPACLGGGCLAALWLVMDIQGRRWIDIWNAELKAYEASNQPKIHPTFGHVLANRRRPRLRYTAYAIPLLFIVSWTALGFVQSGGTMQQPVATLAVALGGNVLVVLALAWFMAVTVKHLCDAALPDGGSYWRRWIPVWAFSAVGVAILSLLGWWAIDQVWNRAPLP